MAHDLAPAERAPTSLHPLETDAGSLKAVSRSRIPHALTSFIGRGADVAAVQDLLLRRTARLVTLTGPGGVGKTRLALHIAHEMAPAFADGVVFVPLAPIRDPTLLLSAIAREFEVRETGGQAVADLLVNHLGQRQLLLVLDNLEQVARAAPLVTALLADCPRLTVLATSRARLHVSGEHRFQVSPLPLPNPSSRDDDAAVATIAASPAVQLFVARTQAVAAGFVLTEENARTLAAICNRLDGLPLAIELAAVRLGILTPAELLRRLEPALPLLTDGPADAPDRLRTMRHAIAWSYDLLTPAEQLLLQHLSVFVGGCPLPAAEAFVEEERTRLQDPHTAARGIPESKEPPSFLETLGALIDASLVQRHEVGGTTRLTMLETIREFAAERLAASGEHDAIAARHAAWCLQLAAEVRRSGALSRREGLAELETEHPNLRAALGWLLAHGEVSRALHLGGELAEFWFRRRHLAEGVGWLEQALAADTGPPTVARANALVGLSLLQWWRDGFARSGALLREAEAVARAAGDAGALAYARLHQGYVAYYVGDLDLAEARGTEGLGTAAAIPQAFSLHAVHWLLAEVALARGDDKQAQEHFGQLLTLARAGGDEISLANGIGGLATLAARRGEHQVALRGYADAAAVCLKSGDLLHAGLRLEQAASIAATIGRAAAAVRLFAAADAPRIASGVDPARLDALHRRYEQTLQAARLELGEEPFAGHWTAGAALSPEEAIAEIRMLAAKVTAVAPASLRASSADLSARERDASADVRRRSHGSGWPTHVLLTAREQDVLHLLADGLGDKAIAAALGVTRRTASTHVAAILTKLGVESRTAAVSHALRQGLLGSVAMDDPRPR